MTKEKILANAEQKAIVDAEDGTVWVELQDLEQILNSLLPQESECVKCGEEMIEERVTYSDGVGDCRGFTCYGCGWSKEEPLNETNKEITKRMIDEFSATTPQKFTIEEQIALQYCYKWLDKED